MLADFYIPTPKNDMKIAVQTNHLRGQKTTSKSQKIISSFSALKNFLGFKMTGKFDPQI